MVIHCNVTPLKHLGARDHKAVTPASDSSPVTSQHTAQHAYHKEAPPPRQSLKQVNHICLYSQLKTNTMLVLLDLWQAPKLLQIAAKYIYFQNPTMFN